MRYKYYMSLLVALLPTVVFAQTELKDSTINIAPAIQDSVRMESTVKLDSMSTVINPAEYRWRYNPEMDMLFPYRAAYPLDLHVPDLRFTPGQARLSSWGSGEIVASGGIRAFPGLMQIESGALGIYQSAGDFTFYAGAMVNKYGYFRGLHTQYGINGSISYQFTPKLSATVFGDYYFGRPPRMANGMPMPPAMIGYYGQSKFGGYLDYQINERWGVQTGVQTVQQVGTNRYRAEPIVTPYYKISKKVAIGLPVGQILYHVLKK